MCIRDRGWYDPATGTPVADVGNILEELGLEVERQNGVTLAELAEMLDNGCLLYTSPGDKR